MSFSMRPLTFHGLKDCQSNFSTATLAVVGILCAVLPLTIPQLVLAVIILVGYAVFQEYRGPTPGTKAKGSSLARRASGSLRAELKEAAPPARQLPSPQNCAAGTRSTRLEFAPQAAPSAFADGSRVPTHRTQVCRSSWEKEAAPSAFADGSRVSTHRTQVCRSSWEKEVDDLLALISPTPASDRMVKDLARSVQLTIRPTLPEAEVVGLSSGDLACPCTLGMGAPEIDIVVSVNPDALPGQLKGRLARCGTASLAKLDARKVQKSAIRACTDRLVSAGGFKFRRSAFRGQEPKVTLLAPATFTAPFGSEAIVNGPVAKRSAAGEEAASIPVDLSVNTMTPIYSDAVLAACARLDSRAKALIVLVKRWARDRGICHAAKGHLSPYAWSLLAAFFLQVVPSGGNPILPPLEGSRVGKSGISVQRASPIVGLPEWTPASGVHLRTDHKERKSVGALFAEFVHFYDTEFNWRSEAASIRAAKRAAPDMALPLHIIVSSEGVPTQAGPHIQCPFEPRTNLGTSMTVEGFARMREELSRASHILYRESPVPSLSELIEPWVVPNSLETEEAELESISKSTGSTVF